jgi:uncharacterized protein
MTVSDSGIAFAIGPVEEGRAMIGRTSQPVTGQVAVCVSRIQEHAAVVEDANPGYWDEAFASEVWGGLIAPPAMIQTWTLPLSWSPEGPGILHGLAAQVAVPGDRPINVTTDVEYFEPVRVGDRLSVTDTLVSISDERKTALGKGHFVVTRSDYRNQRGTLVARATNTLLRYRASEVSDE